MINNKQKTTRKRNRKRIKSQRRNQRGGATNIHNEPTGFYLFHDVLTEKQESEILSKIDETDFLNWAEKDYGTRQFTTVTDQTPDYMKETILEKLFTQKATDLETQGNTKLAEVRRKIEELAADRPFNANHFVLIRYGSGIGMPAHRNSIDYGPIIIGISLGDSCKFRLSPRAGTIGSSITYDLPPRSIYIMSGPSRYDYNHEIEPLPVGTTRISITVRDSLPSPSSSSVSVTGGAGTNTVINRNRSVNGNGSDWNSLLNFRNRRRNSNGENL